MNWPLYFFLSLFISCSLFMGNDKSDVEKILKNTETQFNYCPIDKNQTQLLGQDKFLIDEYKILIKKIRVRLSFVDKYVLWALMQMKVRPDQVSPTSRHQIIINIKGKSHYFDFFTKAKDSYPFLYGLNYILKYFKSKNSLKSLARLLDLYQKESGIVGEHFYNFLKRNKDKINKSAKLRKYYMRAGQILRPGESLPRPNYKNLIKKFKTTKGKTSKFRTLIKYVPGSRGEIKTDKTLISCNMDLNLYSHSLYLSEGPKGDSANFGLLEKGAYALAVSSQDLKGLKGVWDTNLLSGDSNSIKAKFCKIKNIGGEFVLISSSGKNPGQHLNRFLKHNIQYSAYFSDLEKYILSARYLYLVNPVRIVYESNRGIKQDLDIFLKSKWTVYHTPSLGMVWAFGKFGNNFSMIKDPRRPSHLSCPTTAQQ